MNNNCQPPDEARLRALLQESRPAPPLPPRFQQAVCRRIEREEGGSPVSSWLARVDEFADWLLRPRWALAGITALVVVGVFAGAVSGIGGVKQAAQERYLAAVAPNQIR